MPYLDKNLTKKVRKELRSKFPGIKFSVRTKDSMAMDVTIKSGPDFLKPENGKDYEQVNHFHIDRFYEDNPKKRDFLNTVISIMNQEQKQEVYDMDYGSVPNYYIHIQIGKWDSPYEVTN